MSETRVEILASRLARPLPAIIGAVATLGMFSAVLVEPSPIPSSPTRAAGEGSAQVERADRSDVAAAPGAVDDPAATVPAPGEGPAGAPGAGPAAVVPGPSAVPAAGTYRYQVESSRDGTTTVQEEQREIVQLSGDRERGLVEITARLEGESQVSVIDWSPEAALVRSTRISSADAAGRDCSWTPPFAELGALAAGSSWSVQSTCRTEVGGVDTTFEVTGTSRVAGPALVAGDRGEAAVWQIERDRTTRITAVVGGDDLVQVVHERGMVSFDPARGVVLRSDLTITLDGAQRGVTQRRSTLVASP